MKSFWAISLVGMDKSAASPIIFPEDGGRDMVRNIINLFILS